MKNMYKIAGTGSALPEKVIANDDLSKMVETSDEWIRTRTGISSRHIITGDESLTELASEAARKALENSGVDSSSIGLVICATMQGDSVTPALSCVVAEHNKIHAPCFDLNAACTGMLYAFEMAAGYFALNKAEYALIVCAEALSRLTDWTDRGTCILFGDGAGAVVLKKDASSLLYSHVTCEPNYELLHMGIGYDTPFRKCESKEHSIFMAGSEVYKFAVNAMAAEIDLCLKNTGLTEADIDYFLPHQANIRIIDAAAKKLCISKERVLTNIATSGNMSASSIAVLLDEHNRKGTFKKGDILLLVAFGAGMTQGSVVIKW